MDYRVGNVEVVKDSNSDSKNRLVGYQKAMMASQKKQEKGDKNNA